MSGHNPNAEQGPRVATAEDEAYDKTKRALLQILGFDLEDVNKDCDIVGWSGSPLNYFCWTGNFIMARYVVSRGADCRHIDQDGRFPMLWAAEEGQLEIIEWLYHECGTHEDIRKQDTDGASPLRIALCNGHMEVVKWLIRKRALARLGAVDGDDINNTRNIMRDLRQEIGDNWQEDKRRTVLTWAQTSVANYETVVKVLLTGMIVRSNQTLSPLVVFKGTSGILELITHYVSGTKHQLRTLRQLIDRLPDFIAYVPFLEEEDEDEDEEDY